MSPSDNKLEYSKYFSRTSPLEIKIDKDDIFYRDKYNEIINYIKTAITDPLEDLEIFNYLKPNGMLLININSGTDILDFIKLICSNYYITLFELRSQEILNSPENFFNNFKEVLFSFLSEEKEDDISSEDNEKKIFKDGEIKKRLILINQHKNFRKIFENRGIFTSFLSFFQNNEKKINLIEKDLILIWVNYDYQEILDNSDEIFDLFDLFIRVPNLKDIERETILRNFSERNPKIVFDINAIVNETENWEVKDLSQLLKTAIFKHYMKYDLNDTSNEITEILIEMIGSGEYIPLSKKRTREKESIEDTFKEIATSIENNGRINSLKHADIKDANSYINFIQDERPSEFMLSQLYEAGASKNYNELVLIIDKLNKKEPIEENDRKILGKYPFILNDSPNIAQINLEKAKKRIDMMKQAFGK